MVYDLIRDCVRDVLLEDAVRIQVNLPRALLEALQAEAKRRGCPVSHVIRERLSKQTKNDKE